MSSPVGPTFLLMILFHKRWLEAESAPELMTTLHVGNR